jgi:hypothetical protein
MNTTDAWRRFFLWSTLLNYAVLSWWFLMFVFLEDWMRDLHGRWFPMTPEQFRLMHYGGMAVYEIIILSLFLVPCIAITIVQKTAERKVAKH